jgi:hypothetical protein
MPIINQIRQSRLDPKSTILIEFSKDVTSQCGEDGIREKIFEIIGTKNKWCVEFGAWDGKKYSNTYDLINNNGWNGILIEGNDERFVELSETYAHNELAHLVCQTVGFDPKSDSLDYILASVENAPKNIDMISIDIDGNDYYIFESLVDFRPRVVIIEFNPSIPNDVFFVQDRDFTINQGCSLLALIELGKTKGYELVAATWFNAFFVVAEEFPKFDIADNSIDAMYTPFQDGRIFHGYDGTIFCVGMEKLLWHKIEIAADALQILGPDQRVYGDHLPHRSSKGGK